MNLGSNMVLLAAVALLAQGCSTFTDPNGVVIIDTQKKSQMVIIEADKRAIFTFPNRAAYACPEPSPDVKADIETAIKSLVDVSAKLPNDITATAKSELEANAN